MPIRKLSIEISVAPDNVLPKFFDTLILIFI
jgi:hypothetical protein